MVDPQRYGDITEDDLAFARLTGLVRLRHAARYLGVGQDDVRRRVVHGSLRGRKVGSVWYVSESELERYAQRLRTRRPSLRTLAPV